MTPINIFSSIKHYKYLIDLRNDEINEMNLVNFLKLFKRYNNKNRNLHYTDLMIV